jgi:hypothetical protein
MKELRRRFYAPTEVPVIPVAPLAYSRSIQDSSSIFSLLHDDTSLLWLRVCSNLLACSQRNPFHL